MNKLQLQELPWYSRVRRNASEFNFYFVDGGSAICFNDQGEEFKLSPESEVELVCSMKEHDLQHNY